MKCREIAKFTPPSSLTWRSLENHRMFNRIHTSSFMVDFPASHVSFRKIYIFHAEMQKHFPSTSSCFFFAQGALPSTSASCARLDVSNQGSTPVHQRRRWKCVYLGRVLNKLDLNRWICMDLHTGFMQFFWFVFIPLPKQKTAALDVWFQIQPFIHRLKPTTSWKFSTPKNE